MSAVCCTCSSEGQVKLESGKKPIDKYKLDCIEYVKPEILENDDDEESKSERKFAENPGMLKRGKPEPDRKWPLSSADE